MEADEEHNSSLEKEAENNEEEEMLANQISKMNKDI